MSTGNCRVVFTDSSGKERPIGERIDFGAGSISYESNKDKLKAFGSSQTKATEPNANEQTQWRRIFALLPLSDSTFPEGK